ncbi:MAG: hypothetical protein PHG85_01030 [Candidatus Altiarchaeota archaeon]|nr:hypothetical protein [Candidatus Altiarchaeota archaeon]
MAGKTRQGGGRQRHDEPEFPESKHVTSYRFQSAFAEEEGVKVTAFEGLGSKKKDIIAVGKMPDKLTSSDNVCVFQHGGRRFISAHGLHHTRASALICDYMRAKSAEQGISGGTTPFRQSFDLFQHVANNSTRLLVEMDGPEKTFIIDGRSNDPKARKAAGLLVDLGIDRKSIEYNPGKFKPKVMV